MGDPSPALEALWLVAAEGNPNRESPPQLGGEPLDGPALYKDNDPASGSKFQEDSPGPFPSIPLSYLPTHDSSLEGLAA